MKIWLIIVGVYVAVVAWLAFWQRKLIYFPPAMDAARMEALAMSERLDPWNGPGGQTIGWKRLCKSAPSEGQLLVLHGNACGAFQCGHYADAVQQVAALDVFIVEYPGYGNCPGTPSERALDRSAEAALQGLDSNRPIYLLGESLGTGVATYLAGKHPNKVRGVVLFASYTSLVDVAKAHLPFFPVRWILRDRFSSQVYLRDYHGPVAMLVGENDRVVPAKYGHRLYNDYSGPKRLWEFRDADHESLMMRSPQIWREIVEFWKSNQFRTL